MLQASGVIAEIEPLCVLDFYVHESCQRQGVGKSIFEVSRLAEDSAQSQERQEICAGSAGVRYLLAACIPTSVVCIDCCQTAASQLCSAPRHHSCLGLAVHVGGRGHNSRSSSL